MQKFAADQTSVHTHFNQERHLYSRPIFKLNRTASLAEWRELGAAKKVAGIVRQRLVRLRLTASFNPLMPRDIHPGSFEFDVFVHRVKRFVAPNSGFFKAAKRNRHVIEVIAIDINQYGSDTF